MHNLPKECRKASVFSFRAVFYSYKYNFVLLHVAESPLPDEWWRCGGSTAERMWEGDQPGMMREIQKRDTLPKCFPLENNQSEPLFHLLCLLFFFLALPELQRFQLMNEAQFRVGGRLGAWSQ